MTETEAIHLFKCLSDKSRLQILKSLAIEDMYVERLAERLGITAPTVSFHLKNAKNYYAPIFDIGQYTETDGELRLPVSVTVNHAAADLSHVHRLLDGLQEALNHPAAWCAT